MCQHPKAVSFCTAPHVPRDLSTACGRWHGLASRPGFVFVPLAPPRRLRRGARPDGGGRDRGTGEPEEPGCVLFVMVPLFNNLGWVSNEITGFQTKFLGVPGTLKKDVPSLKESRDWELQSLPRCNVAATPCGLGHLRWGRGAL